MFDLQLLRAEHKAAVLNFELANRTYFAESINDRGDAYFADYEKEHRTSLDEQESGAVAFYVLVDDDGKVVGRFNLYELTDSTAVVGYRIARVVAGRGVATQAVRDLCRIARQDYGLTNLRAATSYMNVASQRVLEKAGFVADGQAEVGGQPGLWYELDLTGI
jgi:ribosomal-protein-alanine N-acetyltransferase